MKGVIKTLSECDCGGEILAFKCRSAVTPSKEIYKTECSECDAVDIAEYAYEELKTVYPFDETPKRKYDE